MIIRSICFEPTGPQAGARNGGAHASRVRVQASRPNFGHPLFREFPARKSLRDEVFGATPKNTRRRRYAPRNAPARPSSISEFGLKTWRAGNRPGNYPKLAAEAVELRKSKLGSLLSPLFALLSFG